MEWLERHRASLAALLVVLVAVAAFGVLQAPRRPALQVVASVPPTPAPIKVHVTGAVVSPGVYELPADARIDDALRAAGGPSASANMASLNLATPLKDGQQVVIPQVAAPQTPPQATTPPPDSGPIGSPTTGSPVPTTGSTALATGATPVPSGKLNLNSATRQQLEALPGIGTVLAGRILEYRQAHNGFTSVDELKDSKILNSSTFEKVRGLIEIR